MNYRSSASHGSRFLNHSRSFRTKVLRGVVEIDKRVGNKPLQGITSWEAELGGFLYASKSASLRHPRLKALAGACPEAMRRDRSSWWPDRPPRGLAKKRWGEKVEGREEGESCFESWKHCGRCNIEKGALQVGERVTNCNAWKMRKQKPKLVQKMLVKSRKVSQCICTAINTP